jgi:hypothetical protein
VSLPFLDKNERSRRILVQTNGTFNGAHGLVTVSATFRAVCAAGGQLCN